MSKNKELAHYIKERLNEGHQIDNIKQKLKLSKHSSKDIENAFLIATIEYDRGIIATEMSHFRRILLILILLFVMVVLLLIARS